MAVDPGTLNSFDLNDTTPITTNTGAVVLTLTAESLFPQGSVGGTPTVSSSDTSIATVSASAFVLNSDSTAVISDITITGVAIGTSTITVSFTDPGTVAHSVTATVTVEAPDYLDQSGLRHFWDKIKSLFIKNENGAVTTDLLANSAVTTAKINASAITNAKLATAAVQTTNILDGAVTSDKIDWTTFTVETGTVSQVAVNTSWVTLKTFTIANDGNYILWTKAIRAANSASGAIISMRIQKNGTNVLQFDAPTVANYAGNHDVLTQGMATFSASAGDVVTISIVKDRTNYTSNLGCQYALAQVC